MYAHPGVSITPPWLAYMPDALCMAPTGHVPELWVSVSRPYPESWAAQYPGLAFISHGKCWFTHISM